VRCLAMGFLLESPVQLADSQVLHLSTPKGALQKADNSRATDSRFATTCQNRPNGHRLSASTAR